MSRLQFTTRDVFGLLLLAALVAWAVREARQQTVLEELHAEVEALVRQRCDVENDIARYVGAEERFGRYAPEKYRSIGHRLAEIDQLRPGYVDYLIRDRAPEWIAEKKA